MSDRRARPVIVFAPDWSQGNPYLDRLRTCLQDLGVSVVLKDYPPCWLVLNRLKTSVPEAAVIHIHWLYTLIAPILWTRSAARRRIRLFLLLLDLALLRLRGVRIVWTIHNLVEHESTDTDLETRARRLIAQGCHQMIVHSESARAVVQASYGLGLSHKISVARHGNYDGIYTSHSQRVQALARRYRLDDTHTTILFFGSIRLYKGVDRLVDAFLRTSNARLRLLIAGRPFTDAIGASISHQCAGDPRITREFGFIDRDDVAAYFALADVVVIPFERTLSSGSAILAMTLGKALILPSHARVLDLADENGAIYFDSQASLVDCLQNLDQCDLQKMGRHNRRSADALAWPAAAKATLQAYGLAGPDLVASHGE